MIVLMVGPSRIVPWSWEFTRWIGTPSVLTDGGVTVYCVPDGRLVGVDCS